MTNKKKPKTQTVSHSLLNVSKSTIFFANDKKCRKKYFKGIYLIKIRIYLSNFVFFEINVKTSQLSYCQVSFFIRVHREFERILYWAD